MDKFEYAVKQEIAWLEEDLDITQKCIDGTEPTQWSKEDLRVRLRDARDELARLKQWMQEYEDKHNESKSL